MYLNSLRQGDCHILKSKCKTIIDEVNLYGILKKFKNYN